MPIVAATTRRRRMVDLAHLSAAEVTSSAVEAPPRRSFDSPLCASITTSPGVRDVVPIHEWPSSRLWRPKGSEPLGETNEQTERTGILVAGGGPPRACPEASRQARVHYAQPGYELGSGW